MSDLIRRSDAIEALGECPYNWTDTSAEIQEVRDWEYHKACIEAVDAVDAVSVVRCKECRKAHVDGKTTHHLWCTEWGRSTDTFGYCERGEREGE